MVTSASQTSWSSDVAVTDLETASLPKPSVIRFKLFTLDNRVIIRKLGKLSMANAGEFHDALKPLLATGC